VTSLPSGEVTFVFTDIEGSTELVQLLGYGWDDVLADHNRLMRDVIATSGGIEVSTAGDAFFVAYTDAAAAVEATVAMHRALETHLWPDGLDLRIRAGIHTGEARIVDDDYAGLDVHRAARICSVAWGGQVLVSEATASRASTADVAFDDLGEHRLKDLASPMGLRAVIHPDVPTRAKPPRSLSVLPNNLPAQLTSLVGRDEAVEHVGALVGDHRLVTLTGAGGTGKTRLALQVAADEVGAHEHGVWLVELAGVQDPRFVSRAVARVLDVRERGDEPILRTLRERLRDRAMLLVLDNCEHVIDACAELVADLLAACPRLRVLATSREALDVAGEIAWPVPPLALPASNELSPAMELFAERARAARPAFVLDDSTRPAVASLCRGLDGLPLAIELAASRVRSLSVHDILSRLDDRFRLLAPRRRGQEARQATLEAAVDWSYDLLNPHERTVFARLGVFVDGFTLKAAEHVAGRAPIDPADVVDDLGRLVDKSLVVAADAEGGIRYRLLETMRAYALRRLAEADEVETRHAHLAWAADTAEAAPDTWVGRRREEELGNFRTALAWSMDGGDILTGTRIATAAQVGQLPEWYRWCERLLECEMPDDVRGWLSSRAGGIAFMFGDWERSLGGYTRGRELLLAAGERVEPVLCLVYIGLNSWGLGDLAMAEDAFVRSIAEAEASGSPHAQSRALIGYAWWLLDRDLSMAEETARRCETQVRHDDLPFDVAHALEIRARVAMRSERADEAQPMLARALDLTLGTANEFCLSHFLESIALMAAVDGEVADAARLLGAVEALRTYTGDRPRPWDVSTLEWCHRMVQDALGAQLEQITAEGRALSRDEVIAAARAILSG